MGKHSQMALQTAFMTTSGQRVGKLNRRLCLLGLFLQKLLETKFLLQISIVLYFLHSLVSKRKHFEQQDYIQYRER